VATFWLLVATVRVVLHDDCARDRSAAPAPIPVEVSVPAVVPARPIIPIDSELSLPPPPRRSAETSSDVAGPNAVRPNIAACYQRFLVPGVAMVNVVITKSGRVAKADVTGKFAGTPTGACIERAVKTARFPRSNGISVPYPFMLK